MKALNIDEKAQQLAFLIVQTLGDLGIDALNKTLSEVLSNHKGRVKNPSAFVANACVSDQHSPGPKSKYRDELHRTQ